MSPSKQQDGGKDSVNTNNNGDSNGTATNGVKPDDSTSANVQVVNAEE